MANTPVLGIIDCPHCGRANMVGWDKSFKEGIVNLVNLKHISGEKHTNFEKT